jgi:hypothetical protein
MIPFSWRFENWMCKNLLNYMRIAIEWEKGIIRVGSQLGKWVKKGVGMERKKVVRKRGKVLFAINKKRNYT